MELRRVRGTDTQTDPGGRSGLRAGEAEAVRANRSSAGERSMGQPNSRDIGVEAYEGSVHFIGQLRRDGFKIALVTSSENCTAVLKATKLDPLFDVRVDGQMVETQNLAGKPAPDTFLMAARLLGVEPRRAVVVEDAISGIQAGASGKFGLVIGVARKGNAEELKQYGANVIVNDLSELVD